MITIRRIVENKDGKIEIEIPPEITSEKVEVTITSMEEDSKKKIDLTKFWGKLNLNMTVDEIDVSLRKLREEWDRELF